jgi:23S rRNA (uracil1939-C5)-methyltransferase
MAQVRQIGRAHLALVVYGSCNPATLARDARLLVDAGFVLERVLPIDQFLYSDQLEAVATFRRPRPGRALRG